VQIERRWAFLDVDTLALVDRPSLFISARVGLRYALALAVFGVPERIFPVDLVACFEGHALAGAAVVVPLVATITVLSKANALAVNRIESVATAALLLVVAAGAVIGIASPDLVLLIGAWEWQGALRCSAFASWH